MRKTANQVTRERKVKKDPSSAEKKASSRPEKKAIQPKTWARRLCFLRTVFLKARARAAMARPS